MSKTKKVKQIFFKPIPLPEGNKRVVVKRVKQADILHRDRVIHSPNRTYIATMSGGDRVKVTWLNGVQICSTLWSGVADEPIVGNTGQSEPIKQGKTKSSPSAPIEGKTMVLTAKQLRAEVVKGSKVFNKKGTSIPMTIMAEKFPDRKINVVLNNKAYYFV